MTHRVVVLALPGVLPFELGIPSRIFGLARGADGQRLYEVRTCALRPGLVSTETDFEVNVSHGPELLAEADTVVVPATHGLGGLLDGARPGPDLAAALSHLRPGTRLVSICTGAFVLAAAGLLDGRRATTHWWWVDRFVRLFPEVELDPDVLFVDDGDVLTSAGVAAGVDLCLHIVRRDHGAAVANRIARRCVVPPWRDGGQAQFIEQPVPTGTQATTAASRDWAVSRLDEPVSLAELARRSTMSVRTFTRRFREEVGLTPGQWLTQQRVERARQLLEETELSIDEIARRAGFGTAASMRQHLHARLGVAPTAYRRTFRSTR